MASPRGPNILATRDIAFPQTVLGAWRPLSPGGPIFSYRHSLKKSLPIPFRPYCDTLSPIFRASLSNSKYSRVMRGPGGLFPGP